MEDSVAVSPVLIVLARVSSTLNRKFPELDASQTEMLVTTSPLVPAQFDHAGNVAAMATAPAEAAAHVIAGRVVTDDTLLVPAAPGSPVCSCTNVDGAVNAVPPSMLSHLLARVVAARPLAIVVVLVAVLVAGRGHRQVRGRRELADYGSGRRWRVIVRHWSALRDKALHVLGRFPVGMARGVRAGAAAVMPGAQPAKVLVRLDPRADLGGVADAGVVLLQCREVHAVLQGELDVRVVQLEARLLP